jgi:Uma2 family endonuclease/exonuclease VII small subunit
MTAHTKPDRWLDRVPPRPRDGDWEWYPSHGDPPLTDTELQRTEREALYPVLEEWFRDRPDVYVSADLFVYYEEDNRNRKVAPDVFVCFGVPREMRRVYKTWEERHGLDWVLEIVAKGTWRTDLGRKRKLYAERMGVQEYFLYDPEGLYLKQPLLGFRRKDGALRPLRPAAPGRLHSELLGLDLQVIEWKTKLGRWRLDFYRPDGTRLLRPAEALEQQRQALEQQRQALVAAEQSARQAEKELQRAQKELASLRAKLDRRP